VHGDLRKRKKTLRWRNALVTLSASSHAQISSTASDQLPRACAEILADGANSNKRSELVASGERNAGSVNQQRKDPQSAETLERVLFETQRRAIVASWQLDAKPDSLCRF